MSSQEFQAVLDLLASLAFDRRTGVLGALLIGAAISDCRTHRIPNRLVLFGLLFGAICTTLWPPFLHGSFLFPLAGMGVGLLLFLPLYLLRAMGAGDVKLLAMVGAFLGPAETFYAALATMIVGGVMAIVFVLAKGTALRMVRNMTSIVQVGLLSVAGGMKPDLQVEPQVSAGRLPYGVAIAGGTIGYLVTHQLGFL